jgi:GDPmannose 4,6-dehydratase
MHKRRALITGITGQDGSYLAELLLGKGYEVCGIVRKTSHMLYANIAPIQHQLHLVQADLLDPVALTHSLKAFRPHEIYNLASQSHPGESFRQPIHTAEITALGAHRMLEALRDVCPEARFYQASSSEMFGWVKEVPQSEDTPHNPANPYAEAKHYAHQMSIIYRRSYGLYIACGILFNHESPRRGLNFVTQKVCYAAACAKLGIRTSEHLNERGQPILRDGKMAIGNLDAQRDWGFAGDYVDAMWRMLQQDQPDDFVIGTGEVHSIRELCEEAFSYAGLRWQDHAVVDEKLVRPTETGPLVANPAKARRVLGWTPQVTFRSLVRMMVDAHVARLK